MKKILFWVIPGILIIIFSITFIVIAGEKAKYSEILTPKDIPGFYLTSKGGSVEYVYFTERWETVTREKSRQITEKFLKKGGSSLTDKDTRKVLTITRRFYPTRDGAINSVEEKRSYYIYEFKENSPSGRRYGDISKYLVVKNNPDARAIYFAKGKTYVEIRGDGRPNLKRKALSWEFIEKIAGIVESRL